MFKNKRGFVRAGWHLAGAMGALYGLIFLLNFLASFAAIAWLTATGEYDPATGALTGRGAQLNDILFYMLMFLQEAAMIAVPLLAWNKLCRQPLAAMGLPARNIDAALRVSLCPENTMGDAQTFLKGLEQAAKMF